MELTDNSLHFCAFKKSLQLTACHVHVSFVMLKNLKLHIFCNFSYVYCYKESRQVTWIDHVMYFVSTSCISDTPLQASAHCTVITDVHFSHTVRCQKSNEFVHRNNTARIRVLCINRILASYSTQLYSTACGLNAQITSELCSYVIVTTLEWVIASEASLTYSRQCCNLFHDPCSRSVIGRRVTVGRSLLPVVTKQAVQ